MGNHGKHGEELGRRSDQRHSISAARSNSTNQPCFSDIAIGDSLGKRVLSFAFTSFTYNGTEHTSKHYANRLETLENIINDLNIFMIYHCHNYE
jgi:hypothetical protein